MEYRLQSMYNHMEGRTASVVPPFYSLLPGTHIQVYTSNVSIYLSINTKQQYFEKKTFLTCLQKSERNITKWNKRF